MQLSDFDYVLPSKLIARYPLPQRSGSRLLCLQQNGMSHRQFVDLPRLVMPGDLLVFNNTKVIPARLMGRKMTGGQVEVLIERILDNQHVLVQMRVSKPPQIESCLQFSPDVQLTVKERRGAFYVLSYTKQDKSILEVIEAIGEIPLPHYMHRKPQKVDQERYQTIYAKEKGSVAAPTAGLHFDAPLLERLTAKKVAFGYVTLHIGAGTFSPVRTENLSEHKMHAEYVEVSNELCQQIQQTKQNGNRVIAVGTTSVRALETASAANGTIQAFQGDTDIFIRPGYQFQCVDALITNLHLPRSTLLMLVCALGGHAEVMTAYREAVQQAYRFYSYGDAMWVEKKQG